MYNKIRIWINNNGWLVGITSVLPIVVAIIAELLTNNPFTFDINHNYLFMCLILLSFKLMYDSNLDYYNILIIIILQILINSTGLYPEFAKWLSSESSISYLFAKLPASGGADLISYLLMIINTIILVGMLIFERRKSGHFNMNRFFFSLGSGAFILTTFLFHVVTVELGYKGYEEIEKNKIIKALNVDRDQQFKIICEYEGYVCALNGQEEILKLVSEEEQKVILTIPKNNEKVVSIGNVGKIRFDDVRQRVGIFKLNNRWIIEYKMFETYWVKSSENFFLLCSVAHIFWAYFTIFLIFSHNKRILKKKNLNNNTLKNIQ